MKAFIYLFFLYVSAAALCSSETRAKVDCVEIIKHKRELNLIENDKIIKTYHISLGRQSKGHKREEGDNRTPEGAYFIKRKVANHPYHRALEISYPNPQDREQAKKRNVAPGQGICIHGIRSYAGYLPDFLLKWHRLYDWTSGSIAVTNIEIDEIFDRVDIGTPVIVFA